VGPFRSSDNHDSGSEHVKAVDGRLRYDIGKAPAQTGDDAVLFVRAAPWYGKETAGFIDHDYLCIGKEQLHP
jgi:hypothetical protein